MAETLRVRYVILAWFKYSLFAQIDIQHISAVAMTYNDMPGMIKLTSASNPRDLGLWQQGVVPECPALPWESLLGPKLKIYVEITHSEHFVFYEKNLVVGHFLDFV